MKPAICCARPECRSPEWQNGSTRPGIGEERAILVDGGAIIAARVVWDEPRRAGAVADARLVIRIPGTRRAVVRLPDGIEAMAEGLIPSSPKVRRCACASRAARLPKKAAPSCRKRAQPVLAMRLALRPPCWRKLVAGPLPVRSLAADERGFEDAGWDDLVEEALTGRDRLFRRQPWSSAPPRR